MFYVGQKSEKGDQALNSACFLNTLSYSAFLLSRRDIPFCAVTIVTTPPVVVTIIPAHGRWTEYNFQNDTDLSALYMPDNFPGTA